MTRGRMLRALALALGLVFIGGSKAQALLGIPDEVPGATLLFPFFKVNPTPTASSRQDSLIVITNTANPAAVVGASGATTYVHVTIWTVRSEHVVDFSIRLTEHDVWSCSLLDLLVNPNKIALPCGTNQAPPIVLEALKKGDLLAGYITADVVTGPTSLFPGEVGYPFQDWNILIGHLYLVDLPAGSATGFNATSIEAATDAPPIPGTGKLGHPAFFSDFRFPDTYPGFYANRCIESQGPVAACVFPPGGGIYDNRERIDGFSGDARQTLSVVFGAPGLPTLQDSPLSLIVRYFALSALNGSTELWLWKDRNTNTTPLSFALYDEDENVQSVSFAVPDEVNFTSTKVIISPNFPGGWFRLRFTCGQFGYCEYDNQTPASWGTATALRTPIQALAYSLQFANSQNATLRWDAAFPAHRQYTTYVGGTAAE